MIERMRQGCKNIHQGNPIEFDIMFLFIYFLDNFSHLMKQINKLSSCKLHLCLRISDLISFVYQQNTPVMLMRNLIQNTIENGCNFKKDSLYVTKYTSLILFDMLFDKTLTF